MLSAQTTKPNLSVDDVSLVLDTVPVYLRICPKSWQVLQAPADASVKLSSGKRLPPSGQMPTEHDLVGKPPFFNQHDCKKCEILGE